MFSNLRDNIATATISSVVIACTVGLVILFGYVIILNFLGVPLETLLSYPLLWVVTFSVYATMAWIRVIDTTNIRQEIFAGINSLVGLSLATSVSYFVNNIAPRFGFTQTGWIVGIILAVALTVVIFSVLYIVWLWIKDIVFGDALDKWLEDRPEEAFR